MFKILKEGKLTKTTVIYKDKCKKCGCEFEFDDEYITKSDKSLDQNLTYKCPYCGKEITKKYDQIEKQETVEEVKPDTPTFTPDPKDISITPYPYTPIFPAIQNNVCEGCPTYEKIKNGETVIGDGCYFCSKYPYKVTVTLKN